LENADGAEAVLVASQRWGFDSPSTGDAIAMRVTRRPAMCLSFLAVDDAPAQAIDG